MSTLSINSIYTASGSPTIPDPTPLVAPPGCNGHHNNGHNKAHNNGHNNGRPHRPGGRG